MTDRWQKFSDVVLDDNTFGFLATYADEFLVHGVDVEGKRYIAVEISYSFQNNFSSHKIELIICY